VTLFQPGESTPAEHREGLEIALRCVEDEAINRLRDFLRVDLLKDRKARFRLDTPMFTVADLRELSLAEAAVARAEAAEEEFMQHRCSRRVQAPRPSTSAVKASTAAQASSTSPNGKAEDAPRRGRPSRSASDKAAATTTGASTPNGRVTDGKPRQSHGPQAPEKGAKKNGGQSSLFSLWKGADGDQSPARNPGQVEEAGTERSPDGRIRRRLEDQDTSQLRFEPFQNKQSCQYDALHNSFIQQWDEHDAEVRVEWSGCKFLGTQKETWCEKVVAKGWGTGLPGEEGEMEEDELRKELQEMWDSSSVSLCRTLSAGDSLRPTELICLADETRPWLAHFTGSHPEGDGISYVWGVESEMPADPELDYPASEASSQVDCEDEDDEWGEEDSADSRSEEASNADDDDDDVSFAVSDDDSVCDGDQAGGDMRRVTVRGFLSKVPLSDLDGAPPIPSERFRIAAEPLISVPAGDFMLRGVLGEWYLSHLASQRVEDESVKALRSLLEPVLSRPLADLFLTDGSQAVTAKAEGQQPKKKPEKKPAPVVEWKDEDVIVLLKLAHCSRQGVVGMSAVFREQVQAYSKFAVERKIRECAEFRAGTWVVRDKVLERFGLSDLAAMVPTPPPKKPRTEKKRKPRVDPQNRVMDQSLITPDRERKRKPLQTLRQATSQPSEPHSASITPLPQQRPEGPPPLDAKPPALAPVREPPPLPVDSPPPLTAITVPLSPPG